MLFLRYTFPYIVHTKPIGRKIIKNTKKRVFDEKISSKMAKMAIFDEKTGFGKNHSSVL
jgi:hypothetical protein